MALGVKNLPANAGDIRFAGLILGSGRSRGSSTPVFLPGEFHGQRSLAGYSPWGPKSWTRRATNPHTNTNGIPLQHPELTRLNHSECWPRAVSPKRRKREVLARGGGRVSEVLERARRVASA